MEKFIIFFFSKEPKEPEVIEGGLTELLLKVNEYSKARRLFTVYKIGECIGDFS